MEGFLQAESAAILLLAVITVVAYLARWVRLPYTVALVLTGLSLSVAHAFGRVEVTPSLILGIFIPPLVFEGAFHLEFGQLRASLAHVLLLAVAGVVIVALFTGGMLAWALSAPLAVMLVFGALISATDPVAVLAIFRAFGVPRRLAYVVEGESLFNDGTAIVLFRIVLAMALAGGVDLAAGATQFVWVSVGGVGVGLALGWLVARLLVRLDDYLIQTTLTTILAYGSFLAAEQLHVSGVLAVVAAGVVAGNVSSTAMSPTAKLILLNFWDYVTFVANSFVFLLVGLTVDLSTLEANLLPILWAVAATLLGRALVVYGLSWPFDRVLGKMPAAWRHVLFWGGLRGAIALALALSLPADLGPWRDTLLAMTFGVVLFTLLVQGTTAGFLVRRLGLVEEPAVREEYQRKRARLYALQSARRQLERLSAERLLSPRVWSAVREEYRELGDRVSDELQALQAGHPELASEELKLARREALVAELGALRALARRGELAPDAYRDLAAEVDRRLEALESESESAEPERRELPELPIPDAPPSD